MKKRFLALLLIGVLVFSVVGCSQSDTPEEPEQGEEAGETEEAEEAVDLKVALVTDEGGVHDQSFNQSAWEGLQQAEKDLGVEVSYAESQQDADFAPNFETCYEIIHL